MSRGWTAMAAGRLAEAQAAADEVLRRTPWDHAAIVLKVSAASRTNALAGLDVYEAWLGSRPGNEDVYLLEPVALATLTALTALQDRGLQIAALEQLARHGDPEGRKRLAALAGAQPRIIGADAALARLGDQPAAARLQKSAVAGAAPDPGALADALADAGPSSIPALLVILEKGRGPGRAAAAAALGRLHAATAKEALRAAATDQETLVATSAAVALARMDDPEGRQRVEQMLSSEVLDIRLMAAEAWEGRPGPWVDAIRPLLSDPTGLVRLQAARLMAAVDTGAAAATIGAAIQDANPVVRLMAARVVEETAAKGILLLDLPALRRLLRDADPSVRFSAGSALLQVARALR